MNMEQLNQRLQEQGVQLWVDGGLLRFRAPGNKLEPALLTALQRHKKDLIAQLQPKVDAAASIEQPLTVGQQALWFLHQSAPTSPAYNVASAARIQSPINVEAMIRAFETLVSRHESLRTTFESRHGDPIARVARQGQLDFRQIDSRNWDEDRLRQEAKAEYEQPFPLQSGPLLRVRLFTVAPDDHVFLMVLHHIVFDAWSLWLLQDEFRTLYAQYAAGEVGLLAAPAGRYGDYVRHQQQLLASSEGERLFRYWETRLAGNPQPLELPLDRPRPNRSLLHGGSLHFRLPAELSSQLKTLGRAHGATPFATLLALFKALLYRYTGQPDFIVGTTTAGRTRPEFNRVVGYFVNSLPIRSQVDAATTFADYLYQVKGRVLEALEHQEYPFPLMVERIVRGQGGARPLCNVMFGLQKPQQFQEVVRLYDEQGSQVDWGGLNLGRFELDQQEGQFDLTLEMMETADSFHGTLKYDVELFDEATVQHLAEHYLRLAAAVVNDPQRPLDDYALVDDAERAELLRLACAEHVPPPDSPFPHRLFETQAARQPSAVAAVAGDTAWTFAELNARANRLARQMEAAGLAPGDRVACLLDGGLNTAVALLATWKAGGTYVPLNASDPTARLQQMLADCQAKLVLALPRADDEPGCAQPPPTPRWLRLVEGQLVGSDANLDEPNGARLQDAGPPSFSAEQPAYIIYTSGSTGVPKGVCVSHRALAEHLTSICAAFEYTRDDRALQFANTTFDPSLEQMLAPWMAGGSVVFRGGELWTPADLWDCARRHRLTMINLPPAYFAECSEALDRGETLPDSLRLVIVGGDVFPLAALDIWRGRPVRLLNAYGPTEAVITASLFNVAHYQAPGRMPIGRTRANLRAYVLDRQGRLAPRGVAGELCLAGTSLASGYLNDVSLTAARFVSDPWVAGERMYRTGDLVRWNNQGELEFLGRSDRQLKIRGFRIETGEIEAALASCPGVRQAVIQVVRDTSGEAALAAWIVPCREDDYGLRDETTPMGAPSVNSVQAFLRTRLPAYMVPQYIEFMNQFPVNASGKIDLAALPAPQISARSRSYTAPRSAVEQTLAEIWSRILDVERVGVNDDFFELGGASLKSMRIAAAVAEAGLVVRDGALRPELIFEYPTIGELATQLTLSNPA